MYLLRVFLKFSEGAVAVGGLSYRTDLNIINACRYQVLCLYCIFNAQAPELHPRLNALHPTSIHGGNMLYLSFSCAINPKTCATCHCTASHYSFNKRTHLSLSKLQSLTCPRDCSLDCLSDHSCGPPASCGPCAAAI